MLNITILDDDREFVDELSAFLTKYFSNTSIYKPFASNSFTTQSLKNYHTDLIIANAQHPTVCGIEIVKAFKKEKNPAKFIILDSEKNFEFAKAAVKEGVFDYLTKPIDYNELADSVRRLEKILNHKNSDRQHSSGDVRPEYEKIFSDLLSGQISDSTTLSLKLKESGLSSDCFFGECALINIHMNSFSRWLSMCWDSGLESFYHAFSNSVLTKDENFELILGRVFYNNLEVICINKTETPTANILKDLISDFSRRIMETFSIYSDIHVSKVFSSASEIIKFSTPNFPINATPDSDKIIENAIKFIQHHYYREITLDEVAKYVMLSREYFCSYYKQKTGEKFLTTLNKHRIEVSKRMLLSNSFTINQIAERVGYRSSSHYHKLFRKYCNMSPNEYRKTH